jgi:hypothetical protein
MFGCQPEEADQPSGCEVVGTAQNDDEAARHHHKDDAQQEQEREEEQKREIEEQKQLTVPRLRVQRGLCLNLVHDFKERARGALHDPR